MVYQAQEKGCGYAAVKTMLEINGCRGAVYLPEPHITEQAPSLGELISYASEFGLTLSGYKFLEPSGLASWEEFPLMAVLSVDGKDHMVVLRKKRGKKYLVLDPSEGASWRSEEDLLRAFSGIYLRQLSCSLDKKKAKRPKIKRPSLCFLLPLFPILEGLIVLFGLTFFANGGNFPMLILFVASYCLVLLARTAFLIGAMSQFDSLHSKSLARSDKENRKEWLKHYLAYKKASITPFANLPEDLACFAVFYFLIAFNEPIFACFALIPLAVFGVENVFFRDKIKRLGKTLEERENQFLQEEGSADQTFGRLTGLLSFSRFFTRFLFCKKAFYVLLCLVSACLGLLNGSFSSNRFLLLAFSCVYLFSLFERIFEDVREIEEEKRERGSFLHYFCCSQPSLND